jgi:hypothetical protein
VTLLPCVDATKTSLDRIHEMITILSHYCDRSSEHNFVWW